ncbi:MAG TPA: nucleotidyl transferase AbiEii/AbiGii toxin family protein [bacterium]
MLSAGVLTFQEFIRHEPLPLATIQDAVLNFLRNRDDVVLFGAHAVNAYVSEPRMTQDIDLLSLHAKEFALKLQDYLRQQFHIAVRVREISKGKGYRIYQIQKSGNRHLVDVRPVETLPLAQRIEQVLVVAPAELIATKVISYYQRRGQPKAGTDWRDVAILLLTFPELKSETSPVVDRLIAAGVGQEVLDTWKEIVSQEIRSPEDGDEF